jgi:hypothetical protein
MTLILSNEEVEQLLDVKDCIDMLEDAYRDQAAGRAISQLRMDTEVPCGSLLCAKAPHPNASKLFIDFFLSGETQKLLVGMNRVPARSDVKPKNPKLNPAKLKLPSSLRRCRKSSTGIIKNSGKSF